VIRLDESRRAEAIEAGWQAYAERVPHLREAYERACDSWRAIAVVADDDVIGALLERGGVIHLGIVPGWRGRWASRRVIRSMLAYGRRTELMADESTQFVSRIKSIDASFDWQVRAT
jgi:hypothetical protein